jgi:hypothetical protein
MQLDGFLQSVEQQAPRLFTGVTVIYKPTSHSFERAYAALESAWPEVRWIREFDFREDVVAAIGPGDTTVFHTDDDVYFRSPGQIYLSQNEACFSLRLGLNTIYCYPLDIQEQLVGASIQDDRVGWNWRTQGPGAYSYPLALNGHIFRTREVEDWCLRATYANPNELEAALQKFRGEVEPRMASFKHSVVVSIPANIVNETYPNRHANLADVEELNERFLAGDRVDVGAMDFSGVGACHQEIAYAFRSPVR